MKNLFFKYKHFIFAGIVLFTVLFAYQSKNLNFDFRFEKFLSQSDDSYQFFLDYKENFEQLNNTIFVAVESPEKDIFNKKFLTDYKKVTDSLLQVSNIDTIINLLYIQTVEFSPFGFKKVPLLNYSTQQTLDYTKKQVVNDQNFNGVLFTKDQKYLINMIKIDDETLDSPRRDELIEIIEKIHSDKNYKIIVNGDPYFRTSLIKKIKRDFIFFNIASALLVFVILLLLYRSFWGIFIPSLSILVSFIWLMGIMGTAGIGLGIVTTLLPMIVMVVVISDVIHFFTKYFSSIRENKEPKIAIIETMGEVGAATFLTSLTTGIGFFSLFFSEQRSIREFGIFAGIGVLLAFFITIIIVPYFLHSAKLKTKHSKNNTNTTFLERIYSFSKNNSRWILAFFGIVILLSFWGISKINTNVFILDDLKSDDPLRQSIKFFEKNAYGIRNFEMAVIAKNGKKVTDIEQLKSIEKIQNYLQSKTKCAPFVSPSSYFSNAYFFIKGKKEKYRTIPKTQKQVDKIIDFTKKSKQTDLLYQSVNESQTMGRISTRMIDNGSQNYKILCDSVMFFIDQNIDQTNFSYKITGLNYIAERVQDNLVENLLKSLIFAFVTVSLIMVILFRSLKMLLISFIPNLIPLLVLAGIIGFTQIPLKSSTAIIFTIAFGIAVDDTIHFLSHLKLLLGQGHNMEDAIHKTTLTTGKALIVTTLVLLSGFLLSTFSSFMATFYIGFFATITLTIALITDLFLLPILLRIFYRKQVS